MWLWTDFIAPPFVVLAGTSIPTMTFRTPVLNAYPPREPLGTLHANSKPSNAPRWVRQESVPVTEGMLARFAIVFGRLAASWCDGLPNFYCDVRCGRFSSQIGDFGTSRWSHHTNSTGLATYTTKSSQSTQMSLAWSAPEVRSLGPSTRLGCQYASFAASRRLLIFDERWLLCTIVCAKDRNMQR